MSDAGRRQLSRRGFMTATIGLAAAAGLEGCTRSSSAAGGRAVGPASAPVAAAEAVRRRPGAAVRTVALTAGVFTADLGGRRVTTWGYNGTLPGPEIRLAEAGRCPTLPISYFDLKKSQAGD